MHFHVSLWGCTCGVPHISRTAGWITLKLGTQMSHRCSHCIDQCLHWCRVVRKTMKWDAWCLCLSVLAADWSATGDPRLWRLRLPFPPLVHNNINDVRRRSHIKVVLGGYLGPGLRSCSQSQRFCSGWFLKAVVGDSEYESNVTEKSSTPQSYQGCRVGVRVGVCLNRQFCPEESESIFGYRNRSLS